MIDKARLLMKLSLLLLLLTCFSAVISAQTVDQKNNREIIRKARDSYYSLRRRGLSEFHSDIENNWQVTLADVIKANPTGAEAGIKLLNGLHFAMAMDQDGQVKVTHRSDAPPANDQLAASFDKIFSGMEQAVSGFFGTWNAFMLSSPFPSPDATYQQQHIGDGILLTYNEGNSSISTTMNKEFVISEVKVASPEFNSSVRPRFSRNEKGLMLMGYAGDYVPNKGPGKIHLDVDVEYQEINGLQLPRKLRMASILDGASNQIELSFLY